MSIYDDDDDNTFEEIKKLQNARKSNVNIYDDDDDNDFENDKTNKTKTKTSSKKHKSSRYEDEDDQSLKREFESYSAPKHLLDTLPIDEDYDPTKKYRAPTVAEQETEYRSRWRKRELDPTRDYDPFTGKGDSNKGKSYREIMMETQLAKEEKDILYKIEKKKKEEQELEKQRKRKEEYDNKHNKSTTSTSSSSGSSSSGNKNNYNDKTPPSTSTSTSSQSKYYYKVFKNGDMVEDSKQLKLDEILTFGRDYSRNKVVLEHPSISSVHASISYTKRYPVLLDLNSTNQTFLNGKEITPHKSYDLYKGDKIKFGASTREYIIYKK